MRILHYILGFPPMRSGGLTRYAIDLMHSQKVLNHEVFAIYPGNPSLFFRKKNAVVKEKAYNGIPTFCIKNALFLPLLHGVKNPSSIIALKNEGLDCFRDFFQGARIDVLHVHSLMGLPVAFLLAARECGVKIVYTSHDYFGLCAKVNFVSENNHICKCAEPESCLECNKDAKPLWYLWLRNSKLLVLAKKVLKR